MAQPVWRLAAPERLGRIRFDSQKLRELHLRFPHDVPPGATVVLQPMAGGNVVGDLIPFALTVEQLAGLDVAIRPLLAFIQGLLGEELAGATLDFLPDPEPPGPPTNPTEAAPGLGTLR